MSPTITRIQWHRGQIRCSKVINLHNQPFIYNMFCEQVPQKIKFVQLIFIARHKYFPFDMYNMF